MARGTTRSAPGSSCSTRASIRSEADAGEWGRFIAILYGRSGFGQIQ